MPHLRSLKTAHPTILQGTLDHLASLPSLLDLEITANPNEYPEGVPRFISNNTFTHLQSLKVTVEYLPWFTALVKAIHSPYLHTLRLNMWSEEETADDFHAFATALSTRPCAASLRSLTFNPGPGYADSLPGYAVPLYPYHFQPLFALRSLESIVLKCIFYFAFSNEALAEMGRSWPNLRRAELCQGFADHTDVPTSLTLRGLVQIAELCPRLELFYTSIKDVGAEELYGLFAPLEERMRFEGNAVGASATSESSAERAECQLRILGVGKPLLPEDIADEDVETGAADELCVHALTVVLSAYFPRLRNIRCIMDSHGGGWYETMWKLNERLGKCPHEAEMQLDPGKL